MGKLEDLERRIEELERRVLHLQNPYPQTVPTYPSLSGYLRVKDCGCDPNKPCGNSACPRLPRVTCSSGAYTGTLS